MNKEVIDMKVEFSSIWRAAMALVLALSFGLIMAVPVMAADQKYTSPVSSDSTATTISDIRIMNVTHLSATVSWVTAGLDPSQVEYSTDLSYRSSTPPETGDVHTVMLDNLDNNKSYHFRIKTTDSAGNVSISPDATFVTATAPPMQGVSPYGHSHCACRHQ
jgi:hypothetical protein